MRDQAPLGAVDALSLDAALAQRFESTDRGGGGGGGGGGVLAWVHSVYERTVNVIDSGFLFCVVDASLDDAPRTVRIAQKRPTWRELRTGDEVRIEPSSIVFKPGAESLTVSFTSARRWVPTAFDFTVPTADQLREHAAIISRRLSETRPRSPFEELSAAALEERVARLDRTLETGDRPQLAAAAADLIGLGAGLTPSGDDVLAGLMVLASQPGMRLGSALPGLTDALRAIEHKTTAVSASMLEEAAAGRGRQPLHELMALLSRSGSEAVAALRLDMVLERISQIGH
ncbi:MAG: DUF2877 domain-containing protein, partial [Pseudolysinimonas sp.]